MRKMHKTAGSCVCCGQQGGHLLKHALRRLWLSLKFRLSLVGCENCAVLSRRRHLIDLRKYGALAQLFAQVFDGSGRRGRRRGLDLEKVGLSDCNL